MTSKALILWVMRTKLFIPVGWFRGANVLINSACAMWHTLTHTEMTVLHNIGAFGFKNECKRVYKFVSIYRNAEFWTVWSYPDCIIIFRSAQGELQWLKQTWQQKHALCKTDSADIYMTYQHGPSLSKSVPVLLLLIIWHPLPYSSQLCQDISTRVVGRKSCSNLLETSFHETRVGAWGMKAWNNSDAGSTTVNTQDQNLTWTNTTLNPCGVHVLKWLTSESVIQYSRTAFKV